MKEEVVTLPTKTLKDLKTARETLEKIIPEEKNEDDDKNLT